MSQNDRMTHDDDRYREDVRITRDESSGTANIMIVVVIAVLGLGLLYWAATSYQSAPSSETTIIKPAPAPALAPPADTAPAPLNNDVAPAPSTNDVAPAELPAAPAAPAPGPAPAPAPAQ